MTQDIDMNVLRQMLASAEDMIRYYSKSDGKIAQNRAMEAAGLEPLHSESSLQWDIDQTAKRRCEVECLKAVIAHFEGETQAEAA